MEITRIDEAGWADSLNEYDPKDQLTQTVRETLTLGQQCALRELRDRLPESKREVDDE